MKPLLAVLTMVALTGVACGAAIPQTVRGSGTIVTQAYEVGEFSKIKLSAIGAVDLVQGDQESVRIETDGNILPYLQVKVENGRLVLADRGNVVMLPSQSIMYHVTAKKIEGLEVDSSGSISSDSVTADELAVNVSGSGDVKLGGAYAGICSVSLDGSGRINAEGMECDKVEVDVSASGTVTLAGETAFLTVTNSGSGDALLGDLTASDVTARLDGSGTAIVWAVDSLDAKVSGSGGLSYFGDPAVTSSLTSSGALLPLGAH